MNHDPRHSRLTVEFTDLMNLADRSNFIKIDPIDRRLGWPPERYLVTYTCKGIAGIDDQGAPMISEFHQLDLYLSHDFPIREPDLKWLTPIWHPNIEHEEPHHVCTNNVQNWYPGKRLADLVIAVGEMVQYKRYHALWQFPWPLDREAAKWVLTYAEPRGLVGPKKPIDSRELLRAYRMRTGTEVLMPIPEPENVEPITKSRRIKIGKSIQ